MLSLPFGSVILMLNKVYTLFNKGKTGRFNVTDPNLLPKT